MANRYSILPAATTSNTSSVNTWSATSGGATGASVPISTDNALTDALSVAGAAAILNVDATFSCLSLDFTGATNTPTLAHSAVLRTYGTYTGIAAMTHTGTQLWYFMNGGVTGNITWGHTISCGIVFGDFNSSDIFTYTFLDALDIGSQPLAHYSGNINTNGRTVTCGSMTFQFGYTKTFTMDASVVNCTSWNISTPPTFAANTATTINISGAGALAAGNVNYNGASFNLIGTAHTITGNPTGIKNIQLGRVAGAQAITATGATITTGNVTAINGTNVITITGGTWIKTGGGTIALDYMTVIGSTATPASTWYAGAAPHSINGGGNLGWMFGYVGGLVSIQGGTARRIGLSTDTKPVGLNPGSRFWEFNTDKYYITNDGTNWVLLRGKNYDSYARNLYR